MLNGELRRFADGPTVGRMVTRVYALDEANAAMRAADRNRSTKVRHVSGL
jgi:hypothetical protein